MEHASTPSRESVFPDTFTSKAWNFDADLSDQSPKCATHCCLRTSHRHDICPYPQERRCGKCGILNPSEHYDGCIPRCLTCGSDEHPHHQPGLPSPTKETWAPCS
ncbi:hypothetical protein MRX96_030188 [Rhipicephalus microplus]